MTPTIRDRVYGGTGEACPLQLLDRGGHHIFCPSQHFVIKSSVVVQISCYFTVENVSPAYNQGINEKNELYHWITCRHCVEIS